MTDTAKAMLVVTTGTLLVATNSTMVNVALPAVGADLNVVAGLDWIVTSYLLAVAVAQPLTGWLCERFGSTRTFVVSLVVFCLGSLAVAGAISLEMAVLARFAQGLGAGALIPIGMMVIHQMHAPERRGMALGLVGMAVMAGPAVGPVLGGWLADAVSWRLIFLFNVPVGLMAAAAGAAWLRDSGPRRLRRLDAKGAVLIAVTLGAVMLTTSRAADSAWTSRPVLSLALLAGLGLLVFTAHQIRVTEPLLELRLLKNRAYRVSVLVIWVHGAGHLTPLVLMPVLLQSAFGTSALTAGLVVVPSAIIAAIAMPLAGRWSDRGGPRSPIVVGMACLAATPLLLAQVSPDTSVGPMAAIMALHGLGVGLTAMTVVATTLNVVPTRWVSQASAMRAVIRQVGNVLAVAVAASIITQRIGGLAPAGIEPAAIIQGYVSAFVLVAALSTAGLVLALALPGRARNLEIQELRRQEHGSAAD